MRVSRIRSLKNAPLSEKLVAALLREDRAGAEQILRSSEFQNHLEHFFCFEIAGNISSLIYSQLCKLDLLKAAPEQLRSRIRKDAEYTAIASQRMRSLQNEYLRLLQKFDVVWIKGPAMAAGFYDFAERYFSDFDLLVREETFQQVVAALQTIGYEVDLQDPGSCHQIGSGPTNELRDLFLRPAADFEPCHNITLKKENAPNIELKFNPLDTGLRMRELERFFADCETTSSGMSVPSLIDHLLLQLVHLHKHGFTGWKWRYDIHLLAKRMGTVDGAWDEFVRRAQEEGVSESAWAGLVLVMDRLGSAIPAQVISSLCPRRNQLTLSFLSFVVAPEFLWNALGLPMLVLSATALGDTPRRLRLLRECFFPSRQFLEGYYFPFPTVMRSSVHRLVLICPAAVIRGLFGRRMWATSRVPSRTSRTEAATL